MEVFISPECLRKKTFWSPSIGDRKAGPMMLGINAEPLRTVRATFTAYGSSNSKQLIIEHGNSLLKTPIPDPID